MQDRLHTQVSWASAQVQVTPGQSGPEQCPAPASQPGTERPANQSTAGTRKAVALTDRGCPSRLGVGTGPARRQSVGF